MSYNEDKTEWKIGGGYVPVKNDARGNYIIRDGSGWKTYIDETKCTPDIMEHLWVEKRKSREIPYHGLDNPKYCKTDKEVFDNWPTGDRISYAFNSRGFRDEDWPATLEEMQDSIWLIGDSFTMGMGIAYHECYKKAIEQATGKRVVDISLDGTNPNWRRRIALKIIREIGPEWLIIHWGYIWRYKRKYRTLAQEVRDTIFKNQEQSAMDGFIKTFRTLWDEPKGQTKLIHNFLPKFAGQNKSQKQIFAEIQKFTGEHSPYICWDNEQLDTGRDGWHWGTKTVQKYVENNLKKMQEIG